MEKTSNGPADEAFIKKGKFEFIKVVMRGIITEEEILNGETSAPLERVIENAKKSYNFSKEETVSLINGMLYAGEIYEPKESRYAIT
jgi:DNA replicative helicase MCM subunit Mcm2 (Cdc46/Mcm family)